MNTCHPDPSEAFTFTFFSYFFQFYHFDNIFLIDGLVAHFLSLLFRKHKFLLDGNRNSSNVAKVLEEYLLVQCQTKLGYYL